MAGVSRGIGRFGLRWTALCAVAAAVWAGSEHCAVAQRVRMDEGMAICMVYGGAATGSMHAPQGYLGVDIGDVFDAGGRGVRGAEILHVDHDGPAGKVGLREHDVVLSVNGQAIESGELLRRLLHEMAPGRTVTLTISRGGRQETLSTQMSTREDVEREAWEQHIAIPDTAPASPAAAGEDRADRRGTGFFSAPGRAGRSLLGSMSPAYTGVMLETMAPQLAEFFGAQGKSGLLVRSVDANSPASAAGLRAGDVVVRVNTVGIVSNGDWLRVVRENKGRAISVVVVRERREQTLMMIPNAKHRSSLLPEFWPFGGSLRSSAVTEHASVSTAALFRQVR